VLERRRVLGAIGSAACAHNESTMSPSTSIFTGLAAAANRKSPSSDSPYPSLINHVSAPAVREACLRRD
jgi:hypothetical protein